MEAQSLPDGVLILEVFEDVGNLDGKLASHLTLYLLPEDLAEASLA